MRRGRPRRAPRPSAARPRPRRPRRRAGPRRRRPRRPTRSARARRRAHGSGGHSCAPVRPAAAREHAYGEVTVAEHGGLGGHGASAAKHARRPRSSGSRCCAASPSATGTLRRVAAARCAARSYSRADARSVDGPTLALSTRGETEDERAMLLLTGPAAFRTRGAALDRARAAGDARIRGSCAPAGELESRAATPGWRALGPT